MSSRRNQNKGPKLEKKYEYAGVASIIEKQYKLDSIETKLATVYTEWQDTKDFPIHVDGRIKFKKGDIEGRKKGYWRILDISETNEMTPEELNTCFAFGNVEGQHLIVLITQTGEELEKHPDRYLYWIRKIGGAIGSFCTMRLMELKRSDLHTVASKKASQITEWKSQAKELETMIEGMQKEQRGMQSKLTKRLNQAMESVYGKEYKLILDSTEENSEERREAMEAMKETYEEENEKLKSSITELKEMIEKAEVEMEELITKIEKKDVQELISSDEDEEEIEKLEEQLLLAKPKKRKEEEGAVSTPEGETKKVKLSKEDKKAGPAEWLGSESEDDDEDDESVEEGEEEEEESESASEDESEGSEGSEDDVSSSGSE